MWVLNEGGLGVEDRVDWPRVKFEVVVECQRFFGRFGDKEDLDYYVEFSPTCFGHFKGRLLDS